MESHLNKLRFRQYSPFNGYSIINALGSCMCPETWIYASVVVCKLAQVEDSPIYKSTAPPNEKFKFVYIPTSRKGYLPKKWD